jgi:predicted Zn-dependent protease
MMSIERFHTDAALAQPHRCGCALHSRRRFTAGLALGAALPALAQDNAADEGVRREVGKTSAAAKLVPAERVEAAAGQQYAKMLQQAAQQRALAPENHPQLQRLRYIAQRLIPYAETWNERAKQWRWEVNLLGSRDLNAFCMPGGKIAFYYGILSVLQLSDDEVAMIMGHEMAHALREHARERMGKNLGLRVGASLASALLGLGNTGDALLNMGAQLVSLKFSRSDESEADVVGLELAARAGYDPASGVTLWQKMMGVNKGAPPAWLSTHPSGTSRIKEIEDHLPKVHPLYARAARPDRKFGPPPKPADKGTAQAAPQRGQ